MNTDTHQINSSQKVQLPGVVMSTGYFLLHFLEMCVVMCAVGIGTLSALLRWVGPLIGYPDFKKQFPELSTVLLALWFAVVMILWMRLRRHEWRPTLEMASTSIAALPLVFGATRFDVIPNSSLFGLECALACALMIVPMLFRLDHYAGQHGRHQSHMHTSTPANEHIHHAG